MGQFQFSLVAGLKRHISVPELHADFLQECARRLAARENPNIVIGNYAGLVMDLEYGGVGSELRWHRVEQNRYLSRAHMLFNALGVPFLDLGEILSPIR